MKFKKLSQQEIQDSLKSMSDWKIDNNELIADFVFLDFRHAIDFINSVAVKAEEMNHHPTWSNSYNKVSFRFSTHDAGNEITDLDIKMAQFISDVAKNSV